MRSIISAVKIGAKKRFSDLTHRRTSSFRRFKTADNCVNLRTADSKIEYPTLTILHVVRFQFKFKFKFIVIVVDEYTLFEPLPYHRLTTSQGLNINPKNHGSKVFFQTTGNLNSRRDAPTLTQFLLP